MTVPAWDHRTGQQTASQAECAVCVRVDRAMRMLDIGKTQARRGSSACWINRLLE
jgi:hypothetical protein